MIVIRSTIAFVVGVYVYIGTWVGAFIGAACYPVAYGYKLAQMRDAGVDVEALLYAS